MDDPDLSARKHLAGSDPAFPARREEAWGRIVTALDGVLGPAGYALARTTWSRVTPAGKSAVHLQRDRYGWDVRIVLRFVTPSGEVPDHPDWPGGEDVTLLVSELADGALVKVHVPGGTGAAADFVVSRRADSIEVRTENATVGWAVRVLGSDEVALGVGAGSVALAAG